MIDSARGLERLVAFSLKEKLLLSLILLLLAGWGLMVAPFDWDIGIERSPVAVDAIPNLGDNQQIVFTEWPGRSPQDVEDQITYPLSSTLMGVAGVKDVRSLSMFGASSIAVIFDEGVEFYWSRSRLMEKLASLTPGTLPDGVQPALGPDATALGQIFWYTLEGRDPAGNPAGGWDLHELRSLQDWTLRFGLLAAEGISEVASIGGHVQEYQVDVNPDALQMHGISLDQVLMAVAASNRDVGAGTTELNRVEYLVRGVGLVKSLSDIEQAVVTMGADQVPIRVGDVAQVNLGPALRRGLLDVAGAEAVGGVVTVREGYNPRQAITNVKDKIAELSRALPARAVVDWQQTTPAEVEHFAHQQGLPAFESDNQDQWQSWLRNHPEHTPDWLTLSQVTLVPFYDRSLLIDETLGTLNHALVQQLLVTLVVIVVMLGHLGAALSVGLMLPAAVLLAFIAMKLFGVEANIVALAGIAIAIGSIVDMGIIVSENVLRQLRENPASRSIDAIYRGTIEVSSAIFTAIATTVISFLPVFVMSGAEGKLFTPLAYTKTFVLLASVVLALTLVPMLLHWLLRPEAPAPGRAKSWGWAGLAAGALLVALVGGWHWLALAALLPATLALWQLWLQHLSVTARLRQRLPTGVIKLLARWPLVLAVIALVLVLAVIWEPLGPVGNVKNTLFIALLFTLVLGGFTLFLHVYSRLLLWCLDHKALFLSLPLLLVIFGLTIWLGFDRVFAVVPYTADKAGLNGQSIRTSSFWQSADNALPGLGREFMPALDEGSFLWMPSTMPHASLGEVQALMQTQNQAIAAIPEVSQVVGKAGRADTALDPAPLSMLETIIHYHNEYKTDESGRRLNFAYDQRQGKFVRDNAGELIADSRGRPYRQWREHIQSPADIWQEIVAAATVTGSTSAPRLQPIEARLLMLQTGMRAAMGLKLTAPDLDTLERAREQLQNTLAHAPGVAASTLNSERLVGKPWLEIHIDRARIARFGLSVDQVQNTLAAAIGGMEVGRTVEGRERYSISVRYPRELRQSPEHMAQVRVTTPAGAQIPLGQLADIRTVQGPEMIRTENTFLTVYITFGGEPGWAEVDIIEAVNRYLDNQLSSGELQLPTGVSYSFAGNYQHQQRAAATLMLVVPLALVLIFFLLYVQFRTVSTALIIFSGVAVAWAGGFVMLYLYGQTWFGNFSLLGVNMRELFQLQPVNLSIAVWVGFLALFGIAVDDGVVMGSYLKQRFSESPGGSVGEIRQKTLEAAKRRVRPCLMTSATTILALLPVLTATGRGADLMIPMAIPTLGGLCFVLLSMFVVPVLYAWVEEKNTIKR